MGHVFLFIIFLISIKVNWPNISQCQGYFASSNIEIIL